MLCYGPGSALEEKREKKSASETSREVVWRGKRAADPGNMPLMPPIRPLSINWSLKCQHVKFTDVSVSLLCRFCKEIFEFEMK